MTRGLVRPAGKPLRGTGVAEGGDVAMSRAQAARTGGADTETQP